MQEFKFFLEIILLFIGRLFDVPLVILFLIILLIESISGFKFGIQGATLALVFLIFYLLGFDYSGEIIFSILMLSVRSTPKRLFSIWMLIALLGLTQFVGIEILPRVIEKDYFTMQSLFENPYQLGLFSIIVLHRLLRLERQKAAIAVLMFCFLTGNRVIIVCSLVLLLHYIYRRFSSKGLIIAFAGLMLVRSLFLRLSILSTRNVSWDSFDNPLGRLAYLSTQFDNGTATPLLSWRYIHEYAIGILPKGNLELDSWVHDFSTSDMMLVHIFHVYGILVVSLFLLYFYFQLKKKMDSVLILLLILLSISDTGIFVPINVFLLKKIL